MSEKFVLPCACSSVSTIIGKRTPYGFVRAEASPPKFFRSTKGSDNKNSIPQVFGNLVSHLDQATNILVEIDEQDNVTTGIIFHSTDVILYECVAYPSPSSGLG
jgi:hypothetical protein